MTKAEIYARVQQARKEFEGNGFLYLTELENLLKLDVMAESAKSAGTKSNFAAAMKLIKDCPETIKGAFIQEEKQYICSDVYGVTFFEPMELPKFKGEVRMNMPELFYNARKNTVALELPKIEELKQEIAILKAEKKIDKLRKFDKAHHDFGKGLPMVNAEYLLNIMQAIEATEILASEINNMQPIYIKGTKGEAILMPIMKK